MTSRLLRNERVAVKNCVDCNELVPEVSTPDQHLPSCSSSKIEPVITLAMSKRLIKRILTKLADDPTGLKKNLAVNAAVDAWVDAENKRAR